MSTAEGSVLVEAPVSEVYRQLLRLEELAKLSTTVEEVRKLDANRFLITASGDDRQRQSILEIILRVPLRRLAWRILSAASSDQLATGVVHFTPNSDRSTCITVKISSAFAGAISHQL